VPTSSAVMYFAVQSVYQTSVGPKQLLTVGITRLPQDDGFSSATGQASERVLVGHPFRESQTIGESLIRV
jgi:hypothetical protein